MNRTQIEWVQNPDDKRNRGFSWNPITGCENHIDGMCKGGGFPCYAHRLANTRLRERYLANEDIAPEHSIGGTTMVCLGDYKDPFYPRFWPERLDQPLQHKKPAGIFTCDMGELFGDWVPGIWQDRIFDVIRECPQHRFYLLTKQPQNIVGFAPFPPFPENCWVGVTTCNQSAFNNAMQWLPYVAAKVKYLSLEPMQSRIITTPGQLARYVDWVIIGAQTGPVKQPQLSWVKEIMDTADAAGIPIFLKNNLKPVWPGPLRQEMPREPKA